MADALRLRMIRQIRLPDPTRIERFSRAPDLGPRLLFFSGGTALRDAAEQLTAYTHNSVHVETPFDSGGSSAELRRAFDMPAVGDVRARLMALADKSLWGNQAVCRLFAYRLPAAEPRETLLALLEDLCRGRHPLIRAIDDPLRKIIRNHLLIFRERMPSDFDPRGASLGNLVLTAGYLANRRHLDPVVFIFSKLAQVRGIVRPVVNTNAHLAVRLADGRTVCGQHRFTGKTAEPLRQRIEDIWVCAGVDDPTPAAVHIRAKMRELILTADCICYPMGSFYSSVAANLLPGGVGAAVARAPCPKVFVPNTGEDPELFGHTLLMQVERLLALLRRDAPEASASALVPFVLADSRRGRYPGGVPAEELRRLGVTVLDCPLVSPRTAPYIDARLLNPLLLSLC